MQHSFDYLPLQDLSCVVAAPSISAGVTRLSRERLGQVTGFGGEVS